jgi:hypothetical protein
MSRSAERRRRRKRMYTPRPRAIKPMSDHAIYLGVAVIGLFTTILAWLFTDGRLWGAIGLVYVALVFYLINFYTFQAYRGKHLGNVSGALARVPLRFVGYGTKEGKPLEAAHDHPETRNALLLCLLICLVVLAGLSFVVVPSLLNS